MSEFLGPLGLIAFLILVNGLMVASEFAIVATSHTRIASLAEDGSSTARKLLAVLQNTKWQTRFIILAQIGITVASLGLGMYGEHTIADWLLGPLEHRTPISTAAAHTVASILAIAILTYLHVVIGEVIPKSLALQAPEAFALRLIGPMMVLERILSPAIVVLNSIATGIMRMLGIPPADVHARLVSPQELELIVEESYESGMLASEEQLFIENILDLKERTAGQVMTPRTRVIGVDVDMTVDEVLQLVCASAHSRFPIYEESLDNIIGMLHIKDLARHRLDEEPSFDLHTFAQHRPITYVPESTPLDEVLVRFRREHLSMAVVVDEYGGTAGILTMEDLLEEVVGEIQDEFDTETAPFEEIEEGKLRVHGALLLDELEQHYDIHLESQEVNTVGGLVMALLGRIPEAGDVVELNGIRFTVESVEGRAVESVCIELPEPHKGDPTPSETQEEEPSAES